MYKKNQNIKLFEGGGFLKLCLTIYDKNQLDTRKTRKIKMLDQLTLDTSVKKIFIIAVAPEVTENYRNLKTGVEFGENGETGYPLHLCIGS